MEKTLKEIVELNKELLENLPNDSWVASYDKVSDMMFLGEKSTSVETFYVPLEDTRFMFKVDKNYKLHGFAIENAKFFVKENPEFTLVFAPYMAPSKFFFALLVLLGKVGFNKITEKMRKSLTAVTRTYAVARTA